jgi:hypothetical protein
MARIHPLPVVAVCQQDDVPPIFQKIDLVMRTAKARSTCGAETVIGLEGR